MAQAVVIRPHVTWLLTLVASCGRIAFDPITPPNDGQTTTADTSSAVDSTNAACMAVVVPEDHPDYNASTPSSTCFNCSGFDLFDMSCGTDDVSVCGVVGGIDAFFPLFSQDNSALLITIGTPTFSATAGLFAGTCAAVKAGTATLIGCSHACSDGSPEINASATSGSTYCVVVEQASLLDTDLRATFTHNPASTMCPL